jgi:glycosyltransferase involved in cell wall biosynthesis
MRILQLCRKFPYPLKDGESIAVTYMAKAYRDLGLELTLLSFNTIKHFFDTAELPPSFDHYAEIHTTYLDNHPTILGAFWNLFSKDSYHISRFETEDFATKLLQILKQKEFDAIQLESVYFAPYIPLIRQHSKALVVMRAHNVEFEIWERVAQNTTFLPKKYYVAYLAKKLKRYEMAQLNNYDVLLAMTTKDLAYFQKLGCKIPTLLTPIGLSLDGYPIREIPLQKPSIAFIGSLDWMPNQEGLAWFLEEVWEGLHRQFPDLELHIAGRNTPDWVFQKAGNGVVVHGEIPDAKAFLMAHPFSIVPLFSGSGMRVKILQGMALGSLVITTTLGIEGIAAKDGKEVLIADTKEAFISKIATFIKNPEKTTVLRSNAQQFIHQYYDNQQIAKGVIDLIQSLK